ncbi:transposase [Chryseobacterium sp. c4a]|uniref:transposase n=1 Tax=Chryseobacterium sp. c4a TaxID=1573582 RepID=UPI001E4B1241|nr:transposase [Chryseobacterium sp. c4a]
MSINFKEIHIGSLIKEKIEIEDVDTLRLCNFMKCTEKELENLYQSENLPTDILLKFSKILGYDFFRLYSQHLILFSPPGKQENTEHKREKSAFPEFRKNLYTKEIIDFVLEQMSSGKKTKSQIIKEYRIPKTTLYKWVAKYSERKKK